LFPRKNKIEVEYALSLPSYQKIFISKVSSLKGACWLGPAAGFRRVRLLGHPQFPKPSQDSSSAFPSNSAAATVRVSFLKAFSLLM
jgi:hypothetical protein